MKKMLNNKKGFTLIELMIVVAIIGILAAIAIPNFLSYQCKAKQSEAKAALGSMKTQQVAYFAEYDEFAVSTDGVGFSIDADARYTYSMAAAAPATNFTATATATINGNADAWHLNRTGALNNNTNACQ
ncbi:MAG: prepilin-type N-terminal cleavage/methylation domain-containing protein [Thermodesulfobacteriota bacterium]|nr:prepilin-type N-terminal cleavage/methylation domain-containing protein [Thermodesulfobacteriota bacterium]